MLMKQPRILLLDEATSNLDTESEALVQAAIDKTIWQKSTSIVSADDDIKNDRNPNPHQRRVTAVILVAHRLSTVINADKIAVVDKGKIVEWGSHDELLRDRKIYYKLVKKQVQRSRNKLSGGGSMDSTPYSAASFHSTNTGVKRIPVRTQGIIPRSNIPQQLPQLPPQLRGLLGNMQMTRGRPTSQIHDDNIDALFDEALKNDDNKQNNDETKIEENNDNNSSKPNQ